jgi:hypothetical protein
MTDDVRVGNAAMRPGRLLPEQRSNVKPDGIGNSDPLWIERQPHPTELGPSGSLSIREVNAAMVFDS